MKTKITIKDIATELGISTSTVSRALKDSPKISKETRQKVKAFADLYHYKPNALALKLRSNKTMIIGVVIPEIVHDFFSRIISGIEKVANGRDYNVMICVSNESHDKEKLNVKMLADGSVDGMLVSIAKETQEKEDFSHLLELQDYDIPLVLFDRVSDEIACDKVIVDDVGGGYKATQHLVDIGCKKIGLISTPDHVSVGYLRKKGYEKALRENQMSIDDNLIIKVNEHRSIIDQIEALIVGQCEVLDGIVAVNEIYAARAVKIAKANGLRVPEDIAVVSFSDGLIAEFSTPTLTTIVQHGYMMGEMAGEILLNRIQQKSDTVNYERKVISTNLKIRDSSQKN